MTMKKYVLTLVFAFIFSQAHAADITPITNAFKAGKAAALTSIVNKEEVDIAVPGTTKKCPGEEAIKILAKFFESNKVSEFKVAHQADKADSGFMVAKMTTSVKEYRVNITYKIVEEKPIILSIRIE